MYIYIYLFIYLFIYLCVSLFSSLPLEKTEDPERIAMTCLYAVRVHSCIIETEFLASHLRAVDVCSASEVKT